MVSPVALLMLFTIGEDAIGDERNAAGAGGLEEVGVTAPANEPMPPGPAMPVIMIFPEPVVLMVLRPKPPPEKRLDTHHCQVPPLFPPVAVMVIVPSTAEIVPLA